MRTAPMIPAHWLLLLVFIGAAPIRTSAITFSRQLANHELAFEFSNPYYVSTGLYLSLNQAPFPTLPSGSERHLYRELLSRAFLPNCLLIELGLNPLQSAGAAFRALAPNAYDLARAGEIHLIQALTKSVDFPEPWSVSMFLGNAGKFLAADSTVEGLGHIGVLVSYGAFHLLRDQLYRDHWVEAEAKIKVDKSGTVRKYANSFRVGMRFHSLPQIHNSWYISLRRDRTDFVDKGFSFIRNTGAQFRVSMGLLPLRVYEVSLQGGKKKPFTTRKGKTVVSGLTLGATCALNNPYKGEMGAGFKKYGIGLIVRPEIHF